MDPVAGCQAVNVEAQLRTSTSLLRWFHRFIALRKAHPVFGTGSYEPLDSDNERIFAHVRRSDEHRRRPFAQHTEPSPLQARALELVEQAPQLV